jgi:hypothetical protein
VKNSSAVMLVVERFIKTSRPSFKAVRINAGTILNIRRFNELFDRSNFAVF